MRVSWPSVITACVLDRGSAAGQQSAQQAPETRMVDLVAPPGVKATRYEPPGR
jgi:hypothetical protein